MRWATSTAPDGKLQDFKDGYSLIRDLHSQTWLRTTRPYALRPVLEHYDYTVGIWLGRIDKVRSAQRQWGETRTLPTAEELGIPAGCGRGTPSPPVVLAQSL